MNASRVDLVRLARRRSDPNSIALMIGIDVVKSEHVAWSIRCVHLVVLLEDSGCIGSLSCMTFLPSSDLVHVILRGGR